MKNPIAKAVKVALLTASIATSFSAPVVFAEENETEDGEENTVTITGSRIKRTEVEGPSPIVILSAEDMTDQGFTNIYEAVQSLTANTGSAQGQGYGSNGFTPNAETVNLRGMGPNRTLVLLNGRRIANYPRPFNSQNNVFNLATIPLAAVDRIEIIAGGQSAIYGSDAIAGVMNIITKTDIDATTITVGGHDTAEGGGAGQIATFATGGADENFSWSVALEVTNKEMLTGNQRSWLDHRFDDPSDPADYPGYFIAEPRSVMAMNFDTENFTGWEYLDPVGDCYGTNIPAYRVDRGNYCSHNSTGQGSLINERQGLSLYANAKYEVNSDHTLFADFLYWSMDAKTLGSLWYGTAQLNGDIYTGVDSNGYVYTESQHENNQLGTAAHSWIYMQRTFTVEELGGVDEASTKYEDKMYHITFGSEGTIFDDYDYNTYVAFSRSDNKQRDNLITEEGGAAYFIGTENGLGSYTSYLRMDNIFSELDQTARDTIFEENIDGGVSKVTSIGATVTGDLFEMPEGPAHFAATIEWSREEYDLNLHPRTTNREGYGWANRVGTGGGGERDRASVALEVSLPLLDSVSLTTAARYDDYSDETDVGAAATYQLGLEWRPTDNLLIRSSYATTFKAPDLHQVNAGESGYFQSITDDWLAAVCVDINAGGDGSAQGLDADAYNSAVYTCSDANNWNPVQTVEGVRSGETLLEEETGESTTIGFVWDLTDDISWSLDFYNLKLEQEVVSFPSNKIFEFENECRNGTLDANSSLCQNVLNVFVERQGYSASNPSQSGSDLLVTLLRTSFVNAAMRDQTGVESEFWLKHEFGEAGTFSMHTRWTHVIKYKRQYFIGDEVDEDYREVIGGDFRSKFNTTFAWQKNDWRITLEQIRYGSTSNDPDEGADFTEVEETRLKPWFVYNLGINYSISDDQLIRFGVNNLRNSRPRNDASFNSYPYYDNTLYPSSQAVMGRTYGIAYEVTF